MLDGMTNGITRIPVVTRCCGTQLHLSGRRHFDESLDSAVVQMVQLFGSPLFASFSCQHGFVEKWDSDTLQSNFFWYHFPCQDCHVVAHSTFEDPQHVLPNMDFVNVAFAENSMANSSLRYFVALYLLLLYYHRNTHRRHLAGWDTMLLWSFATFCFQVALLLLRSFPPDM